VVTIETSVEGIRKHKKFKQLVSYQVQVLEKPLSRVHNRYGWEAAARSAFELGAVTEIADTCARHGADADFFRMCISCLNSISNVPKALPTLASDAPTATLVVSAVAAYGTALDLTGAGASDNLATLMPAFTLLAGMARQDGVTFDRAGGMKLLLDLVTRTARPKPGSTPTAVRAADAFASFILTVANTLDRATRTKGGVEALANRGSQEALLALAVMNLAPPPPPPSSASGSSSSAAAAAAASAGDAAATANAHLVPAFRVLDRVARTDGGREALLAAGATTALSPIIGVVLRTPATATLAMRVLARLLGSNVPALVDRIVGAGRPVELKERILSARLLAFMLRDDEYVPALVAGDGALVRRLVGAMTTAPLAGTDAVAALVQVLRRLAEHSGDHIPMLEEVGAVTACAALLRADGGSSAELVAEAVGALAAFIDCPEMVALQDAAPAAGGLSPLATALARAQTAVGDRAVAVAALALVERALFHDATPERLVALGAINLAVAAMRALPHDVEVQLAATDDLTYLASCAPHVDAMVAAGVIDRVTHNLALAGGAGKEEEGGAGGAGGGAGGAAGTGGGGGDDDDDAGAGGGAGTGATSSKAQRAAAAALVASSLGLMTSLCMVEAHIAAAKASGIIKAVLKGFSHHIHDTNVYRNFRDVVSALDIQENEVVDAIQAVSAWTDVLVAGYDEAEAFKGVDDYVSRATAAGVEVFKVAKPIAAAAVPRNAKGGVDLSAAAEAALEHIALLEAVTVSPVFVCVVASHEGVPALLRALGTVAAIRPAVREARSGPASGGAGAGAKAAPVSRAASFGAQQPGIYTSVADDVLARACNTLAHVARVAYEVAGGAVEQDPEYNPVDFDDYDIDGQLHDRDGLAFLARSMAACARPALRQFASASITLLAWLASGHSMDDIREHVDGVIAVQGIEAIVSMLRAHQAAVDICSASAGGLTRVAVTPKGATAVATRGGSRQIVRMLHATASLRSNAGDELLLAYLRLLDAIAAGGAESADILRRQGTVDAVVACVDAGTGRDFRADGGVDAAAAGRVAAVVAGAGGAAPVVMVVVPTAMRARMCPMPPCAPTLTTPSAPCCRASPHPSW